MPVARSRVGRCPLDHDPAVRCQAARRPAARTPVGWCQAFRTAAVCRRAGRTATAPRRAIPAAWWDHSMVARSGRPGVAWSGLSVVAWRSRPSRCRPPVVAGVCRSGMTGRPACRVDSRSTSSCSRSRSAATH